MDAKHFLTSKTLWVNTIAVICFAIQQYTGFIVPAEYQGEALTVINLILRWFTTQPITMSTPQAPSGPVVGVSKIGIFVLFFIMLSGTALAFDWSFKPATAFGPKDIQVYLRDFKNPTGEGSQIGTGVSYGPLYTMTSKSGSWVADIGSACGVASTNTSGQTQWNAGIGICPINFFGLQTAILYDPVRGNMEYGIGFSVTGLVNQLTK